ncbi:MAG TPA: response regulator [Pyrinomonadaceae bacterium]|nr:response regulator [Pyrinomonadaceae bacterium]
MTKSSKKLILLAEDDASMRRFVEVVLQKANYEVLTAEDGLAAMTLIHENDFDLILVDAIMPNFSGFDVCRMIRADEKRNKIPIVILSGLADQSSDTSAQLANAFLIKDANLQKNLLKTLQIMIPQTVQT